MEAIILLGAPGAGKGTVSEDVVANTSYVHVSTGDMLREAVQSGSEFGEQARRLIDHGSLVPDEVIVGIVRERLDRDEDDARYLLDGFPRNLAQARQFDEVLGDYGAGISRVFVLEASDDVVLKRILGRRICQECRAVYHVSLLPEGHSTCTRCGGKLIQRADDNEQTVRKRLRVYREETEALIDYYDRQGTVCRIDANQTREATLRDVLDALPSGNETP